MNSVIQQLRNGVAAGMSQNEAIHAMRCHDVPIIEAIKMTRELFSITLGAAKNAVASHPAYAQVAEASQPLQDEAIRSFMEIGKVNPDERPASS